MGRGQGFDGIERHLPSPRAHHDDVNVSNPRATVEDSSNEIDKRQPLRSIARSLARAAPFVTALAAASLLGWMWITSPAPERAPDPAPVPERALLPDPTPSVYMGELDLGDPDRRAPRRRVHPVRRRARIRVGVASAPAESASVTVAAAPSSKEKTEAKKQRPKQSGTLTANIPLIHLRDPETEHHWYTTNRTAATYKVSTSSYKRVETEGFMYDEKLPGTKAFETDQGFMGYIAIKRVDGSYPMWWLTHEDHGDLYTTNYSKVEWARSVDGWHFEGRVGYLFDAGRPAQ